MTVREKDVDELIADTAMLPDEDDSRSYLSDEIASDVLASYFRAAASLARANLWRDFTDEEVLVSVTIDALGRQDVAMTMVEGLKGLLFFDSAGDYDSYMDAATGFGPGDTPAHLALTFMPAADQSDQIREQVKSRGWELAHEDAYPWLVFVNDQDQPLAPTRDDTTFAEAVCWALPVVLAEHKEAILSALNGQGPVERSLAVQTHAGELTVTFRVPHPDAEPIIEPALAMDELFEAAEAGALDHATRGRFERSLMLSFAGSPEGMRLEGPELCRLVMEAAAEEFDATIATLEASELSLIVFELLPAKTQSDPLKTRWVAEVTRAFYRFLKRTTNLPQADACIRALTTGLERPMDPAAAQKQKNKRKAARQASKKRR